jgi:hypothetical protein
MSVSNCFIFVFVCKLTSHRTIPNEKMSTFSSYFLPFIISGAIQYGFPTTVYLFFRSPLLLLPPGVPGVLLPLLILGFLLSDSPPILGEEEIILAKPKSATTTVRSCDKINHEISIKHSQENEIQLPL